MLLPYWPVLICATGFNFWNKRNVFLLSSVSADIWTLLCKTYWNRIQAIFLAYVPDITPHTFSGERSCSSAWLDTLFTFLVTRKYSFTRRARSRRERTTYVPRDPRYAWDPAKESYASRRRISDTVTWIDVREPRPVYDSFAIRPRSGYPNKFQCKESSASQDASAVWTLNDIEEEGTLTDLHHALNDLLAYETDASRTFSNKSAHSDLAWSVPSVHYALLLVIQDTSHVFEIL